MILVFSVGSMSENIVEQVKSIESEADSIIAEAREKARQMESSVEEEVAEMRDEHRKEYEQKVAELERKLEEQREDRLAELKNRAHEVMDELDDLDPEKEENAVQFILSELQGDV